MGLTRKIKTDKYIGYVRKLSQQFQGKWAAYAIQVTDRETELQFRTVITKLHRMWINDHNSVYSRSMNDMIDYVLESIAPQYTGG